MALTWRWALISCALLLAPLLCGAKEAPTKVCIIGAGIGGSSLAYFLRKGSNDPLQIHVFEKGSIAGGRARLVSIGGHEFEAGASIIHDKNYHLVHFARELGLKAVHAGDMDLGIWGGDSFIFREWKGDAWWASLLNQAMLLLRYGPWDLWQMQSFVQEMLSRWLTMYEPGLEAVGTPEAMLQHAGLLSLTTAPLSEALAQKGISQQLVDELVTMIIRVQYGQSAKITALPGAVGLCGSGGELWHVEGGNWQIAAGLLDRVNATVHMETPVTSIRRNPTGTGAGYNLELSSGTNETCDVVALGAPAHESGIRIVPNYEFPPCEYQHTHVTFVLGRLNHTFFGLAHEDDLPGLIGTLERPSIPFSSISVHKRGIGPRSLCVYKVFSRTFMEDGLVAQLFSEREEVVRLDWAAYPKYKPPQVFAPFLLDDLHLYYLNTFEGAASAMEAASVAAENVARLILGRLGVVEAEGPTSRLIDELR